MGKIGIVPESGSEISKGPGVVRIPVFHSTDAIAARGQAEEMALLLGFDETSSQEIVLAVSELATNLINHAGEGELELHQVSLAGCKGIEVVSKDRGPGIADPESAQRDNFSSSGSLGCGLGAVNRLMDTLEILPLKRRLHGTHIKCRRWVRGPEAGKGACPMEVGAASRPFPGMEVNGDACFIRHWGEHFLVGVIDGLGHGKYARIASDKAVACLDRSFHKPLGDIFHEVHEHCRATRGVVMALARFHWTRRSIEFASVGNVELRTLPRIDKSLFFPTRGILGNNFANPKVVECPWEPDGVMALHSDGVSSRWTWEDLPSPGFITASGLAGEMLGRLGSDKDDATVVVVKKKLNFRSGSSPASNDQQKYNPGG